MWKIILKYTVRYIKERKNDFQQDCVENAVQIFLDRPNNNWTVDTDLYTYIININLLFIFHNSINVF